MRKIYSATFTGHRDSIGIEREVYAEIKKLIAMGVRDYYSGGMGNFDKMCEKAVKELGGKIIFVPYNQKQIKENHIDWYDDIICPFGDKNYSKYDIPKRNQWLVDNCDVVLSYVYKDGGAKNTLDYAVRNNKYIINLSFQK